MPIMHSISKVQANERCEFGLPDLHPAVVDFMHSYMLENTTSYAIGG